jgi:hypothetical protein
MSKKGSHQIRHVRHSRKGKVFNAGKSGTKVPIGRKIKSGFFGIFQGFAPEDVHHAVVLDFQTHQSILKDKKSLLEQERGTLNRPNKIKELKSEINDWEGRIVDDKRRIKFLCNKYNFDYNTLIRTAQWIPR